jgi:peptidoglycan/xylan/chitin deacetylase (PgdA/CDA1 family)
MNDLLILCYHAVSEDWPTDFAVSPDRLAEQLRSLLRRGYRPATLSAALARQPAGKTLVVSFDDAFASVVERALPVMSALGVPGTMYVPTGYVAGDGALEWASLERWIGTPHESELRCMDWDGLRNLAAVGWEIGSHSETHVDLTGLGDAELARELSRSKARCEEELQLPCRSLAYPFGAHDQRVMDAVRDAGYESATILDNSLRIPPGSMVLPGGPVQRFGLLREGVYRHDGALRLRAKTWAPARRARASGVMRALSGSR